MYVPEDEGGFCFEKNSNGETFVLTCFDLHVKANNLVMR
jgi:hypothetical protein